MQEIRIRRNKKIGLFLLRSKARINLEVGSAGSGKSWGTAQHLLIDKGLQQPKTRFLITRTTGPALKKSCWLLFTDMLNTYELPYKPNLSDLKITLENGTEYFFVALDDINKLKSIERINYVWGEEATQFSKDEYMQLNLRCRGDNPYGINQLYFTFNPDDENSFLKPLCENPPEDTAVCHSTYLDNAFNTKEYIATIEELKNQDMAYWLIYGQGIWATPKGLIYKNWDIIKAGNWPQSFDEVIYGVDFGFNNPSALLKIGIKDDELYLEELIYASGLTNSEFIRLMGDYPDVKESQIYADSAETDRIEEISQADYIIYPARKGKNSVHDGIDVIKEYKLHIHEDSQGLIKEIKGYKWKENNNGDPLDEPVKYNDHLMDALRYAIFTHQDSYPLEITFI